MTTGQPCQDCGAGMYPRIAERLGLSWPAFDKHMRESCRAGDPRTAGYSGVSVSEERAA